MSLPEDPQAFANCLRAALEAPSLDAIVEDVQGFMADLKREDALPDSEREQMRVMIGYVLARMMYESQGEMPEAIMVMMRAPRSLRPRPPGPMMPPVPGGGAMN